MIPFFQGQCTFESLDPNFGSCLIKTRTKESWNLEEVYYIKLPIMQFLVGCDPYLNPCSKKGVQLGHVVLGF